MKSAENDRQETNIQVYRGAKKLHFRNSTAISLIKANMIACVASSDEIVKSTNMIWGKDANRLVSKITRNSFQLTEA